MPALFRADTPILADEDLTPACSPPGYEFITGDPVFDPAVHLQLEMPEKIWSMEELGYSAEARERFPSSVAVTSPARILSREGVEALQETARLLQPYIRHRPDAKRVPAAIRGGIHRSRFVRDLCLSKDVREFFEKLIGAPLDPHTLTHHQGHMNFAPKDLTAQVDAWHHDSVAFDYVMMVHDPKTVQGGKFEVFMSTREEGARLVDEQGEPPRDRVYVPEFPEAGYACYMQGTAIWHRATRVEEAAWRASFVQSYVCRDVRHPDPNRFFYGQFPPGGVEPNSALEASVVEYENARHRAALAKAKLDWLIHNTDYTTDRDQVLEWLEASVADVNELIDRIRRGRVPMSESMLRRAADDAQQTGPFTTEAAERADAMSR